MTTSNENQIPTPLEISDFKDGLARGFKIGEANAGILRWEIGSESERNGFIPTQWAYELLESGECDDMRWIFSSPHDPPVMIWQFSNMPAKRCKAVRSVMRDVYTKPTMENLNLLRIALTK